ncbi:MAG TPA: hypothetical protein VHX42_04120 [Candidatus Babeliales bacterium]|jgi:hypothetical protein|nr:hypothetical protein [Candidatus Babeliales bacterium]
MKKFHKVSRALVVPAVLIVANASAQCPLFNNGLSKDIYCKKHLIVGAIVADKLLGNDQHAKKAFMVTALGAVENKNTQDAVGFGERVAIDYIVRKGSDMIGLDGYRDAVLKKLDVLPHGMIRDLVKPMVDGVAEVATHPETLTCVVMDVLLPMVIADQKKS